MTTSTEKPTEECMPMIRGSRTAIGAIVVFALATVASAQTPKLVVVRAETTAVRSTASMAGATVATVARGTELEVLGEDGSFYRVRTKGGEEGFVAKLFVEAVGGAAAAPAAQAPTRTPSPPALDPAPAARPADTQPMSSPPTERKVFIRGFAGLFNVSDTTGLQLGGGIAGRPFSNPAVEIQGDLSWIRLEGFNSYDVTANVLYNFQLASDGFTPYAGAGLNVFVFPGTEIDFGFGSVDVGGGSEFAIQLIGGLEVPVGQRRAFRGELRLAFFDGATALSLLAGFSF